MNRSWNKLIENVRVWLSSPVEDDPNPNDVIPHFWERNIGEHYFGQFSMAALKGRAETEDRSQVVVERGLVFCGVYDGRRANSASSYIVDYLYNRFRELSRRTVSGYTFRRAIFDTENAFIHTVQLEFLTGDVRRRTTHGSSCLIGVITGGILYYANLGDSRAVLGSVDDSGNIVARQLTQDHNVNVKEVRQEYEASHPGNERLLVKVNGMWHIKGLIQVTRSIGDVCFKEQLLSKDYANYYPRGRTQWPLLSSDPSVESMYLKSHHRFVIFATKGLWEHLTNLEAAEEVHKGPNQGAARRLVKRALRMKAIKAGMSYEALKAVSIENRCRYVDDISVIVLFVDHESMEDVMAVPEVSLRAFVDEAGPSNLDNQERK